MNDLDLSQKVDAFWNTHTIKIPDVKNLSDLLKYMKKRRDYYPHFSELMELDHPYEKDIILDFGCGPGFDLINFVLKSMAEKIIGMDISDKALKLARNYMDLIDVGEKQVLLMKTSNDPKIDLENSSIDHILCGGVLHHVAHPEIILSEFYRILKPGKSAIVMVYNKDSIFYHMYVAYCRGAVEGLFYDDLTADEIFSISTDGKDCPKSRCYSPSEFIALCAKNGWDYVDFRGGYLSHYDSSDFYNTHIKNLLKSFISDRHKEFLKQISFNAKNSPFYNGKLAGIGGVYKLSKESN